MRRELLSSGQLLRRITRCVQCEYYYYVLGWIPVGKDPKRTDEKLIRQYEIRQNRMALYRDALAGRAKVRLYRFGRLFVLLATSGVHTIFQHERMSDIRETPLLINGLTVKALREGGVSVQWTKRVYKKLRRGFLKAALSNPEKIKERLERLRHPMYPGVIQQKERIIRAVTARRKRAGKRRLG